MGMRKCLLCDTKPVFNYEGQPRGIYCKAHMETGMVNVVCVRCAEDDCSKQPTYNYKNETKALYCKSHKLLGMVDVKHTYCLFSECEIRASYNFPGEKYGIYCVTHKDSGMVIIGKIECVRDGCEIQPSYNYEGDTIGMYCKRHKLPGMVDVRSKKCVFAECYKQPCFGYEYNRPLYCNDHKHSDMEDVSHPRCQITGCATRPCYNHSGEAYGIFCFEHKSDNMVNVVSSRCKVCNTVTVVKKPYLCLYCKPVTKRLKRQEDMLKDFLSECKYNFIHDIAIKGGRRFRPDFLLKFVSINIVVECDEYQHSQYDDQDELERMKIIQQSLGVYTVFLRYNPDTYKVHGKTVRVSQKVRLEKLRQRIEFHRQTPLDKTMTIEYLYYDE